MHNNSYELHQLRVQKVKLYEVYMSEVQWIKSRSEDIVRNNHRMIIMYLRNANVSCILKTLHYASMQVYLSSVERYLLYNYDSVGYIY